MLVALFCTFSSSTVSFLRSDDQNSLQYCKCGCTIHCYGGNAIVAVLFSIFFLIAQSMEFTSFTVAAHWVDTFVELSVTTPGFLSWFIIGSCLLAWSPLPYTEVFVCCVPVCITLRLSTLHLPFGSHSHSV